MSVSCNRHVLDYDRYFLYSCISTRGSYYMQSSTLGWTVLLSYIRCLTRIGARSHLVVF